MQHHLQLEKVRDLVARTCRAYGIPPGDVCSERVLIREGFYCGHCFHRGGMRAVWFIEEGVVKIYGSENEFLVAHQVAEASTAPAERPEAA